MSCGTSFTFSYLKVDKVLLKGQIFEMQILMNLRVLMSPESENRILSVWSVRPLSEYLKNKLQHKHQIWYSTFVSYTDAT